MLKFEKVEANVASSEGKSNKRRVLLVGYGIRLWLEELRDDPLKDVNLGDRYIVTITKAP
jgi:hypothetical protein